MPLKFETNVNQTSPFIYLSCWIKFCRSYLKENALWRRTCREPQEVHSLESGFAGGRKKCCS